MKDGNAFEFDKFALQPEALSGGGLTANDLSRGLEGCGGRLLSVRIYGPIVHVHGCPSQVTQS